MGDRRIGDRRAPDKGVIKVSFKSAVIYLICAIVIIVSVSVNIVLARYYMRYKKAYEELYRENQEVIDYDFDEETEVKEVEEVEDEFPESTD